MNDLIERLRFLASGQDDQHSVAITEATDALEQQAGEIEQLRAENAELRMDNEVLRASRVAAAEHVEWLREANDELLKDAAMEGKKS